MNDRRYSTFEDEENLLICDEKVLIHKNNI